MQALWRKIPQIYRYMLGGFILSLNAGLINVIALLGSFKMPVSHMTGIASNLGISIVNKQSNAPIFILLILSYVGGSAISGLLIHSTQLRFGRRYGVLLMIESAMLFSAIMPFKHKLWLGLYLLAMACGVQNGMVTTYSGSIVRTSHVTGLLTDLGIIIGQSLVGHHRESWRWQMHVVLFTGFLGGGICGTLLFDSYGANSIVFCASLTGVIGLGYGLWRHFFCQQISVMPFE